MTPGKRRVSMRPVAFVVLTLLWGTSSACDCSSLSLEQRLRESDSVFLASVATHEPLVLVQLRVHETFKGFPGRAVRVPVGRSDCDYFLPPVHAKPGDRFVIFLSRREGLLSVNRCLGSVPEHEAAQEIAALRRVSRK